MIINLILNNIIFHFNENFNFLNIQNISEKRRHNIYLEMKGVVPTLSRDDCQNQISVKGLHLWLIVQDERKGLQKLGEIITCNNRGNYYLSLPSINLKNYSQLSRKTQIITSNFFQSISPIINVIN